jgi:uncharacterized membrane protein
MGAAMVTLVEHAPQQHAPTAASWLLCTGTAVVLVASMAIAVNLEVWRTNRTLYQPLAITCGVVAALCLALAAVRPKPLVLVIVLVVLLAVPWSLAVARQRPQASPITEETDT